MNQAAPPGAEQRNTPCGMHPTRLMMLMCPLVFAAHATLVIVIFRRLARLEKAVERPAAAED